ncbi:MAG: hypothetical protein JJ891_16920 [Rhizobiaceae bacterium]|nr:hypothetical protein [Rhizobiaceae bacterium]
MPKILYIEENPDPRTGQPRPRFAPSAALYRLGYRRKNLKHDDGRWFTMGEAREWSDKIGREAKSLKVLQKAGLVDATGKKRKKAVYTLGNLFEDWQNPKLNPRFGSQTLVEGRKSQKPLAPRTIRFYRQNARVIEDECIDAWASPADAFDKTITYGMYEEIWISRGLPVANAAMRTLQGAFKWGIKRGKVRLAVNPCSELGLEGVKPRVRVGTIDEILTLVACADAMGLPEIGDMIILAVWTGQRQEDRLQLQHKGFIDGRTYFRQNKTGKLVSVKNAPALTERLEAAAARRKLYSIISPWVILNEKDWQPFKARLYTRRFESVRKLASTGKVRFLGQEYTYAKPIETVATLTDQDLRDTAVTWLARAKNDFIAICSITGHELESATRILRHYLELNEEISDGAIEKMVSWYEESIQQKGQTDDGS